MTRHTSALLLAALLALPAAAMAQTSPGAHFVLNWDLDGDGTVTLAEAQTRRDDLVTSFDADEDGFLSPEEYTAFDAMRAADQEAMREEMAAGSGGGQGKGKGRGMGFGKAGEGGMQRGFNDADGDGRVSRDEFTGRTPDWFAMMDRNGDGVVTEADFGR